MIREEQWLELEGHISQMFDTAMGKKIDYRKLFYTMETSTRSVEEHLGVGGADIMQPWTGSVNYQDIAKGFLKNYRPTKYSSGIKVERELLDDKNFGEVKRRLTTFVNDTVYPTLQIHGAEVFNLAFTDTSTSDSKALCSESHPLSPDNADTQNNLGTLALSTKNIDAVQQEAGLWTNDKGVVSNLMMDTLIVGNEYKLTAKKIVGTDKEPFTADNDINVFSDGSLQLLINPYIRGKKWFLADANRMKSNLYWYTNRFPKVEMDNDHNTEERLYKVVTRFSKGFDDWKWIYGNNND